MTQSALIAEFLQTVWIGIAVAVGVALAHVLFWMQPWRLSRPMAYSLGTIGIGTGIFATGRLDVFAVASGVALPVVVTVALCYYVRGVLAVLERGGRKRDALLQAMTHMGLEDGDGEAG